MLKHLICRKCADLMGRIKEYDSAVCGTFTFDGSESRCSACGRIAGLHEIPAFTKWEKKECEMRNHYENSKENSSQSEFKLPAECK